MTTLLLDSLTYSLIVGLLILGSLFWNMRLWMHDFPPELRATQLPLTAQEKRERTILVAVFMLAMFGLPLWLFNRFEQAQPGITFGAAYGYFFALLMGFNLFDAVVIDWLVLVVWKPARLHVPGSEGLEHVLENPRMHLTNFAKGIVFTAVGAAVLAGIGLVI
jgi:hypothetical protein